MKKSILILALLTLGLIIGFGFACSMVRTEVRVDYDSGNIMDVVCIGPVIVRQVPSRYSFFGSVRMPNGYMALTGSEDWHIALSFRGNSRVSPLFEAGEVPRDISNLERMLWKDVRPGLDVAKKEFLEALAKGGSEVASGVAKAIEQRNRSNATAQD